MSKKEYKYKDEIFIASDNILRIHNIAIPIQKYFADELERQTAGLDLKALNEDKNKIDNLKFKIETNDEYLKKLKDVKEKKRVENIQKNLKSELAKQTELFNTNENYKTLVRKYEIATNRTFELLITEDEIIIPFLEKYLTGDFSKLDFTDISILKFISLVITDFFLLLSENKKKLIL